MTDEAEPYTSLVEVADRDRLSGKWSLKVMFSLDEERFLATVRALDAANKRIDELNKHILADDSRIRELEDSINKANRYAEELLNSREREASLRRDMKKQRDAALARVRELEVALDTIERTGSPGGTMVGRLDGHSCSWCRGVVTPCPVMTARASLKGGGK